MRAYSPGGILIALATTQSGLSPTTSSIHRLRQGLPGYLILFAPLAFAPQRQYQPRKPSSPLVFFHISTHFTATRGIPFSPSSLYRLAVSNAAPGLSPGISHLTYKPAYAPFTPSNSDQCLHPPYYRSCWHGVSRCFFTKYYQIKWLFTTLSCSLAKELYNPKAFFAHTASLRQACAHCERSSTAASRRSVGSSQSHCWRSISQSA